MTDTISIYISYFSGGMPLSVEIDVSPDHILRDVEAFCRKNWVNGIVRREAPRWYSVV